MLDRQRLITSLHFIVHRGLIVFFFALLVLYASKEIVDLDLWLHLKAGETILRSRTIPLVDIFSFTRAGSPWINHEWLFQVVAFLVYNAGGPDGLILMQNIVLIGLFLLLFFIGNDGVRENFLLLFVVLYTTLLATAYRFSIRPDLFSLFFVVLYLFVLRGWSAYKARALWMLPLLQILWTNMHGFFFLGPLIVLVYLLGEVAKRWVPMPAGWRQSGRCDDKQVRDLLVTFFCLILASAVNPQGLTGAAYPLLVGRDLAQGGGIIFDHIQELRATLAAQNILDPRHMLYFKVLIIIALFSFRFNARRVNVTEALLGCVFLALGLTAIRNVAYFCVVAAYVIFQNVNRAFEDGKAWPQPALLKRTRPLLTLVAVGGLVLFPLKGAQREVSTATFDYHTYELKSSFLGQASRRYPEEAVAFLLSRPFPARIFNDFNSGAYLIGKAYPQRRVFIDGRTELYGTDFFKDYVEAGAGNGEVIDRLVATYGIEGFFLTAPSNQLHIGLLRTLINSGAWRVVYFDELAIILLKDTPANAALIDRFGIDLEAWTPEEPDYLRLGIAYRFPWPYLNRARLRNHLEYYAASAREARVALAIAPQTAEAMRYLCDYEYYMTWDHLEAFKWVRNGLVFAPGDVTLRARLALVYDALGEREKALKVINAVTEKCPKFARGFYAKALILQETDRDEALAAARKAAALAEKHPRYQELLGDLLLADDQPVAARKAWEEALRYDSTRTHLRKKIRDLPEEAVPR